MSTNGASGDYLPDNDPLRYCYTEEGYAEAIVRYLNETYGPLREVTNKDHWLERQGLLTGFTRHLMRKPWTQPN